MHIHCRKIWKLWESTKKEIKITRNFTPQICHCSHVGVSPPGCWARSYFENSKMWLQGSVTVLGPNATKDGGGGEPAFVACVEADRISRLRFAAEASHRPEGEELFFILPSSRSHCLSSNRLMALTVSGLQ